MRMRRVSGVAVIIVIAAALCFLYWQMTRSQMATMSLNGHTYRLTVAQTEADREHGLSDTSSLPQDQAMLFVFPSSGHPAIWMKDMNYPIDIVWLSNDKTVVHTVENAQPSSYPDTIFQTDNDSRYVIELPAGTIEKTDINSGDKAEFTVAN